MKRFLLLAGLVCFTASAFAQLPFIVPPTSEMKDTISVPLAPWMKDYMPGPMHGMLERLAGRWSMNDSLIGEPLRTGTADFRVLLDGRVLQMEEWDSSGGQINHRLSYLAYNNFRRQFELTGFGDKTTAPWFMTGSPDTTQRVITLAGSVDMAPQPQRFKMIIRWEGNGRNTIEHWSVASDGKESPLRTIIYRRLK
jgi:hypothetical protein